MGQSAKKRQSKRFSKNKNNWLKHQKVMKQNYEVLQMLKKDRIELTS